MNIKQLESFILVAEEKNFTRAAKQLYMTQPAISFQIKSLEEQLGIQLFERLDKAVELTDAGRLILPEAKKIQANYEKIRDSIAEMKGLKRGHLNIGASTIPGEYLMPHVIGKFKSLHPKIDVVLQIASTGKVVEMLLNREIHLGIVGAPVKNQSLVSSPLTEDRLILIASPQHPLACRESIKAEEMTQYSFIMREQGSGTRMVIENRLRKIGINSDSLQLAMELGSTRAIITAVEAGLGISLVSRWAAEDALKLGLLKEILIEDLEFIRSLYLITNKLKYRGSATEVFLGFLHYFEGMG
ncbi:MAG: selenium metabolism-associated LysR family transcriptional regulator [Clostridia bacterium]|nr:selenium metabolism-associated LysR family transcriptional regulator [Clostridia bacterium]